MCGLIGRIFEFRSNLHPKHRGKWSLISIENDHEGPLLKGSLGKLMFIEKRLSQLDYAHF